MSRISLSSLRPAMAGESRSVSFALQATAVVAASLFIALCAHVSVPLPFTPVPFTLQPFAVILVGMLMGPTAGFAALALYLAEGAAGMPVFTTAGLPGVARLLGPTGGYLFAYPLAAAIAGIPAALRSRRYVSFAAAGAAAMLLVYACGSAWFSVSLHVPFSMALGSAVTPFALADTVKILAAAGMATAVARR